MRAQPEVYPKWKESVQAFGLDLSLGKNYIHPHFGTVNSQLIFDGSVLNSGKQMVLDRRSRVLGECLRDLELCMDESPTEEVHTLFKSVNRSKLSRTVRSISVPVSHGGLSFSWGEPLKDKRSRKTAQLCYLSDLFKKIQPEKGFISIPYLSRREKSIQDLESEERMFNNPVTSTEYHEDFLKSTDLVLVQKRCMTHGDLRNLFLDQPIETLPSLTYLKTYQIPCSDHQVKKLIQKEVDKTFFRNFLQGGQEFGYDSFKEEFLLRTANIELNTKETMKHIVSLMDLDIPNDFLQYLNLGYKPQLFDSEFFSKKLFDGKPSEVNLGKILKPKEFNLPEEFPEYEDFSKEIQEIHDQILLSQKGEEESIDVSSGVLC
jgi:hypothetical protein